MPVADYVTAYHDEMEALKAMDRTLLGGTPEEVPERFEASSPLTYVDAVQAPVYISAGRQRPALPDPPGRELRGPAGGARRGRTRCTATTRGTARSWWRSGSSRCGWRWTSRCVICLRGRGDEAERRVPGGLGVAAEEAEPHEDDEAGEDEPLAGVAEVLERLQVEAGALGTRPAAPASAASGGRCSGDPGVVDLVRHEVDQRGRADHAELARAAARRRAWTPSVPCVSDAWSAPVTVTSPRGGAGTASAVVGVAGQPAPYDGQGLAARPVAQQGEDVEAAARRRSVRSGTSSWCPVS